MLTGTPALVISGAQVMDAAGRFAPGTVTVTADGRFGDVTPAGTVSPAPAAPAPAADTVPAATVLDGRGRWLLPGIYDCHCHITWNDFHHDQRDRKTPQQQAAETTAALWSTLRAGVTSLRDAGGAPAWVQAAAGTQVAPGPRLQIAVDMIGADQAGTASAMRGHVEAALAHPPRVTPC
jgi:imidazolonepropionase-like amidohydrolase